MEKHQGAERARPGRREPYLGSGPRPIQLTLGVETSPTLSRPASASPGSGLLGRLRATMMRDSPGHGINTSSRRQTHTVLSKIFSTGLLMLFDPNSRL